MMVGFAASFVWLGQQLDHRGLESKQSQNNARNDELMAIAWQ